MAEAFRGLTMAERVVHLFRVRTPSDAVSVFLEALARGLLARRFRLTSREKEVLVLPGLFVYVRMTVARRPCAEGEYLRLRVSVEWKTVSIERSALKIEVPREGKGVEDERKAGVSTLR